MRTFSLFCSLCFLFSGVAYTATVENEIVQEKQKSTRCIEFKDLKRGDILFSFNPVRVNFTRTQRYKASFYSKMSKVPFFREKYKEMIADTFFVPLHIEVVSQAGSIEKNNCELSIIESLIQV